MTFEVSMPQLGESIAEGTVIKWHKSIGEKVERDEILFEVSTDKVDTEIPSPEKGYVARILVPEGETVAVNTVVCHLSETPPANAALPQERKRPASESPSMDAPSARQGEASPASASATNKPPAAGAGEAERAPEKTSPLVRRIAAEHGVDLAKVKGSGLGGRVTKQDILDHVEKTIRKKPEKPLPPPGPAGKRGLEDRIEPMSAMRQRISDHMLLSRRTSAHVTTIFEVDMTPVRELKNFFAGRFEERQGVRLTYLPFIIQATCRGLQRFPVLNASLQGKNVHFHGNINIGVAVALDNGLIVPVIRQADTKDILTLTRTLQDLARRARSKELHPDDVQGGTFTITNPGVFGSLIGTPIIHQPQVGILCVGAIQKRPVILPGTDAIAVRSMAYLSLTFDHRLLDGSVADRFLATVKTTIESASFEGLSALK